LKGTQAGKRPATGPPFHFFLRLKELRNLRILMIGDVIGKPGRGAVRVLLPDLKPE